MTQISLSALRTAPEPVRIGKLPKPAKRAHKKALRKLRKAIRAKSLVQFHILLGMAQVASRKATFKLAYNN